MWIYENKTMYRISLYARSGDKCGISLAVNTQHSVRKFCNHLLARSKCRVRVWRQWDSL